MRPTWLTHNTSKSLSITLLLHLLPLLSSKTRRFRIFLTLKRTHSLSYIYGLAIQHLVSIKYIYMLVLWSETNFQIQHQECTESGSQGMLPVQPLSLLSRLFQLWNLLLCSKCWNYFHHISAWTAKGIGSSCSFYAIPAITLLWTGSVTIRLWNRLPPLTFSANIPKALRAALWAWAYNGQLSKPQPTNVLTTIRQNSHNTAFILSSPCMRTLWAVWNILPLVQVSTPLCRRRIKSTNHKYN